MLMRNSEFDSMLARMDAFRRSMNHLFGELEVNEPGFGLREGWPRTNIFDEGKVLTVQAEVPGLRAEDLDVQLQSNVLSISGERKDDTPEGYSVHRRERAPVRFSRSFTLPTEVDPDKARAKVESGVLTLQLTKSAKAMPKQIAVKAS